MSRSPVTGFALFLLLTSCASAETLQGVLKSANVPTGRVSESERAAKITSYAISRDNPFLLAYYVDDGSGFLKAPLHVIRYDRAAADLRRVDLRGVSTTLEGRIPINCFGAALMIRESHGVVYIDTHINPSAGCLIALTSKLAFKAAVSGWLLGTIGSDYAIVRASEIHFMAVHPLTIDVLDLKRNRVIRIYPYTEDQARREFSRLIAPLISQKWCMQVNAPCDPKLFDADTSPEDLIVNESAKAFGFSASFDAQGFGPEAEKQVPPRTVTYIFRERGGVWEHHEFETALSKPELAAKLRN